VYWFSASDAIELAAPGHNAVLVPYEIMSTAGVRRPWPVTVLEVLVEATDSPHVTRCDRDGRRPLRKRNGDQMRFTMPHAIHPGESHVVPRPTR
jgi:hypothetical protein